jgi:ssDNA-binding Zn-finger/Zn-ribbon topoisomerase 1
MEKTNKYQIVQIEKENNNAGTKAVVDIAHFADEMGYKRCTIMIPSSQHLINKIRKHLYYIKIWNSISREIKEDSIVLLQHPFHFKQLNRYRNLIKMKKNNVHFVCVVHDVESLRGYRDSQYYEEEFQQMMSIADVIIVHNQVMKHYFVEKGFSENKIISLEIFDYLTDYHDHSKEIPEYYQYIIIAGNLDSNKSKYIGELDQINDIGIELYGPNCDKKLLNKSNIHYNGIKPADQLPQIITSGFGLVWDGDSIDTCSGASGNYLRYNNPHKLSLYIASGIPVVIWKEAAESSFVRENNLGICVGSLKEAAERIKTCTRDDYAKYREAVAKIQQKLCHGYFTKKSLKSAEELLQQD